MVTTTSISCVESQEFLVVENAVWWSDDCVADSSEQLVSLTLDAAYPTPYGLGFSLTNKRVVNEASNTNLDDTEIVLDYAEVNLSFSGGSLQVASFDYQLPTNSLYGGTTSVVFVDFPAEVGESLRSTMSVLPEGTIETLNLEVIIHARTTGSPGSNARIGAFETRPFIFPITICYGCLGICQPAEDCGGEQGDPPVCPSTAAFETTCGYAQGGFVVAPECDFPN